MQKNNTRKKNIDDDVFAMLSKKKIVTTGDLLKFYSLREPKISKAALNWRIHELLQEKILQPLKRGVYIFDQKPKFVPDLSLSVKRLGNRIKKEFPYSSFCIWSTNFLRRFMIHIPMSELILIEAERDTGSSVLSFLTTNINSPAFFMPSPLELDQYVFGKRKAYIVKNLLTESPLTNEANLVTPKIEKILVDLVAEHDLFIAYQGQELFNIFENISKTFSLNFSAIRRYAKRRNRLSEVLNLFMHHTDVPKEVLR
jgi:hypothetical protein